MAQPIEGPLAALLTPRRADGYLDFEGLERNVELVFENGGTGVVVCGGTGEYPALTLAERRELFDCCASAAGGRGAVVCSNGAMRLEDSVALAQHAFDQGADAVLLPPPHFYTYSQQDLFAYYRAAAERIDGPILLYNLASFTTPLEIDTVLELIEDTPNIIGVKDSSGRLAIVAALTQRERLKARRVLGHDLVVAEALVGDLVDAVISGPASVAPELHTGLFAASQAQDEPRFETLAALLEEVAGRIQRLPYPWALHYMAEERGLFSANWPFPPSAQAAREIAAGREWFRGFLERLEKVK